VSPTGPTSLHQHRCLPSILPWGRQPPDPGPTQDSSDSSSSSSDSSDSSSSTWSTYVFGHRCVRLKVARLLLRRSRLCSFTHWGGGVLPCSLLLLGCVRQCQLIAHDTHLEIVSSWDNCRHKQDTRQGRQQESSGHMSLNKDQAYVFLSVRECLAHKRGMWCEIRPYLPNSNLPQAVADVCRTAPPVVNPAAGARTGAGAPGTTATSSARMHD
jgi:hypothetical protein